MTFKQGLVNARSHIVFLMALLIAFAAVYFLETRKLLPGPGENRIEKVAQSDGIPNPSARDLSARELQWANTAWRYFEENTQESTGLVDSVAGFNATTLWDSSSYLLGLISAYKIGIIEKDEFDSRMSKALTSIDALPLHDDVLPNKSYNTQTLEMTDYANNPVERGIGWSAIDIARFLVPVNVVIWNYPAHADIARSIVQNWDLDRMVDDGMLIGATVDEAGATKLVQEGRIGYEEYAARTMLLMGHDVTRALQYDDYVQYVPVYGFEIPTDLRTPDLFDAHNYVVSESYILSGLEFGLDSAVREYAWRVYSAQEQRYRNTGVLTAVSEDHIDRAPWFVYNTVFVDDKVWNTITDTGEDASEHRTLSTKSALGWHVLFDTDYTGQMMEVVDGLRKPAEGWYSGRYEVDDSTNKSLTANTNGIVLESLHYRVHGPLVRLFDETVSVAAATLGVVGCSTSTQLKSTKIYRVGGDSEKIGCKNCPFVAKTAAPQLSKRTAIESYSSDQPKWCAVTGKVEYPPRRGELTDKEMKMARVAWKYLNHRQRHHGSTSAPVDSYV